MGSVGSEQSPERRETGGGQQQVLSGRLCDSRSARSRRAGRTGPQGRGCHSQLCRLGLGQTGACCLGGSGPSRLPTAHAAPEAGTGPKTCCTTMNKRGSHHGAASVPSEPGRAHTQGPRAGGRQLSLWTEVEALWPPSAWPAPPPCPRHHSTPVRHSPGWVRPWEQSAWPLPWARSAAFGPETTAANTRAAAGSWRRTGVPGSTCGPGLVGKSVSFLAKVSQPGQ